MVGCGGLLTGVGDGPAGAPASASPELRALRLEVAERVAIVAEGSIGTGFDQTLRAALERELGRAGFTFASGGTPDLTARLEARVNCVATVMRGRAALAFEAGGREIDAVESNDLTVGRAEFPDALARRLVAMVVASPRLAAFADARPRLASPSSSLRRASPADGGAAVALARRHATQGNANYNLDRFAEALAEYRAAYLTASDPALLYNIAQCHRRLGHRRDALDYYRKYLRTAKAPPNRAEVERHIAALEGEDRSPR
jgi:tetratricopeptide (TPR) repeat protein